MDNIKTKIVYVVVFVVGIIILLNAVSSLIPTARTAGDSVTDSYRCNSTSINATFNGTTKIARCGWSASATTCKWTQNTTLVTTCNAFKTTPLSSLFGASGVVFLALMGALVVGVVFVLLKTIKK